MEPGKLAVNVHRSSLVSPSTSNGDSSHRTILLAATSHFIWFIPYRTRFIFFKRPAEHLTFESIVQEMKSSLSKTLDGFYPLAGRIRLRESLMELICNGEGVLFIEASANVTLEELGQNDVDGHFEGIPVELLQDLAQTDGYVLKYPWTDAPLFIIQVTGLLCGGFCVSIRFNHQALDGTGTWHFFQSWAETCSGKALSLPPVVMNPPDCISVDTNSEAKHLDPPANYVYISNSTLMSTYGNPKPRVTGCMMKCFTFSRGMIARLKEDNPGYSAFQLVTSHIWRYVTRARGLGQDEKTGLLFAINLRGRIESIPAGYVGESAAFQIGRTSVGSLLAGDGVAHGAGLLKKHIGECTESWLDYMRRFIGRRQDESLLFTYSVGNDVDVGSSFRFPVFEDFGFGRAVGMSIVPVLEDGKIYYFPTREGDGVAAYISLKTEVMEQLIADPTFTGC